MNLEELANWLSDMDASWYPFLFLRPAKEERLTNARVAFLAALYGIFSGLVIDVLLKATHGDRNLSPFAFPLALTFGFFVVYRATFAVAWNLRADRLGSDGTADLSVRARAWRANFETDATNSAEAPEEQ